MLTLMLLLILFLPGAILPMALKTLFTSSELNEMGIYMEDANAMAIIPNKPDNPSHDGCSCLVTSLSV